MGRRQNVAIEAYFERGRKRDDASNRYQQTCRHCGELFARGRVENLVDHVIHKCSVVSPEERAEFATLYYAARSSLSSPRSVSTSSLNAPDVSALNALAEASRQHEHLHISPPQHDHLPEVSPNEAIANSDRLRASAQLAMSLGDQDDHSGTDIPPSMSTSVNARRDSVEVAPNTLLSHSSAPKRTAISTLDPLLSYPASQKLPTERGIPILELSHSQTEVEESSTNPSETPFHAITNTSTSVPTPSAKKRVRGAFSPQDRVKVRNVRQRGACLRCRMLKKSCGDQDPCFECSKLENARIWKNVCVRVRLPGLFTVYQHSLFRVTAHRAEQRLKRTSKVEPRAGRLELTLFQTQGIYIVVPWMMTETGIALISDDADQAVTMGDRLEAYVYRVLAHLQNQSNSFFEASHIVQHTLRWAVRFCKGSQRRMLAQALDLWMCTYIITSKESELVFFINEAEPPSDHTIALATENNRVQLTQSMNPASYDMIAKQVKSAAEQRAGHLCKSVLWEFERLIISRKHSSKAELFVTAVLVLLAAERICCFIKRFDTNAIDSGTSNHHAPNVDTSLTPLIDFNTPPDPSLPAWPLETRPGTLWQQGEQFSAVVALMLKLRQITPRMVLDENGVIRTHGDEDPDLKTWLDPLDLPLARLEAANSKPFDADDPDFWELKWACKAFLCHEQLSKRSI